MQKTLYLLPNRLSDTGNSLWTDIHSLKDLVEQLSGLFIESEKGAGRFLHALGVKRHIRDFVSIRTGDIQKATDLMEAVAQIKNGESWGLVSDAGYPAIADPGADLVKTCHAMGVRVIPFPGPSSLILALASSGMNGQRFAFHGYLTRKANERRPVLQALERESAARDVSQIFIEAPYRNQTMLEDCLAVLESNTRLCLAADITGEKETILSMTVREWKKQPIHPSDDLPAIFIIQAVPEL